MEDGAGRDRPRNPMDICPADKRQQRACLGCGLVKTFRQFVDAGCENCEEHFRMQGEEGTVSQCTTGNFFGIVSMISPKESWAARWQMIEPFKPGCYALKMVGTLPGDMVEALPRNMRERYRHLQESSDAYAEE